jgi:hypothetical protein
MNTLDRITRERIMFRSPDVPITRCSDHQMFRSPDAPDHQTRLIDAFVDDTSLAITDTMSPMTPNMMTATMESIAQNWEKILFYSGGALNLKKCSWSMLQWKWKHGLPTLYQ